MTVDADADAGSGPGVQRRGKHAGRGAGGAVSAVADLWLHDGSTGAFVHAVEDDSSQVSAACGERGARGTAWCPGQATPRGTVTSSSSPVGVQIELQ